MKFQKVKIRSFLGAICHGVLWLVGYLLPPYLITYFMLRVVVLSDLLHHARGCEAWHYSFLYLVTAYNVNFVILFAWIFWDFLILSGYGWQLFLSVIFMDLYFVFGGDVRYWRSPKAIDLLHTTSNPTSSVIFFLVASEVLAGPML